MLVLGVPTVLFSPMFGDLLGYEVSGAGLWVSPILGSVMYFWGGRPFLEGAGDEITQRRPGMMLLVALAITVAFLSFWAATLGWINPELKYWWELALLIVIMLLGHWIEMRSLSQTSSALDSLAALLPDKAERVVGEDVVAGTVATDSGLRVEVTALGEDTTLMDSTRRPFTPPRNTGEVTPAAGAVFAVVPGFCQLRILTGNEPCPLPAPTTTAGRATRNTARASPGHPHRGEPARR